jgi:carbamoyl-phosphate synthase large subunit
MPKDKSIKKILIIGSGPIVIGQACEFDYSGAQACKVLKAQGYKVVLVNINPDTIMTDPAMAHHDFIEKHGRETFFELLGTGETLMNLAPYLNKYTKPVLSQIENPI